MQRAEEVRLARKIKQIAIWQAQTGNNNNIRRHRCSPGPHLSDWMLLHFYSSSCCCLLLHRYLILLPFTALSYAWLTSLRRMADTKRELDSLPKAVKECVSQLWHVSGSNTAGDRIGALLKTPLKMSTEHLHRLSSHNTAVSHHWPLKWKRNSEEKVKFDVYLFLVFHK